jgi:hypothetical protein
MKVLETQTATIDFDQDGDAYFMMGDIAYYLKEFIKVPDGEFDGVTHVTNTGGIGIKIDEANEEVEYTVFTI